jgi:hypothetical protein
MEFIAADKRAATILYSAEPTLREEVVDPLRLRSQIFGSLRDGQIGRASFLGVSLDDEFGGTCSNGLNCGVRKLEGELSHADSLRGSVVPL